MSFTSEVLTPWLQGTLADAVYNALEDVVHGTEPDLRDAAMQIAGHVAMAVMRGDKEWTAELGEQARVVFEIKAIRLSKREKALIQRRIWSLATAALKAFVAGSVQGLLNSDAGDRPALLEQARGMLGL